MAGIPTHLTIGQAAAETGASTWQVRRAVDSLGVEIPRVGPYRMIPRETMPDVVKALANRAQRREASPCQQ